MADAGIETQLDKYLADLHAIEEQALTQLRRAPDIAGDPTLAAPFEQHLSETEGQERRVSDLIEARGGDSSTIKDLAGKAGGFGMAIFAKVNPDSPVKLIAHAFSYEHMEYAAYELFALAADRAGDEQLAAAAREIRDQEREMIGRLAANFDQAVEVALRDVDPDDLGVQLEKYLADAHALENQAIQLLEGGPELVEDEHLAQLYREHLEETKRHQEKVRERLDARGSSPSRFEDAGLGFGAIGVAGFFQAQPDTTAKLAGYSYAFEGLEIATYELLSRVAARAGDERSEAIAQEILGEEKDAALKLEAAFEAAIVTSLAEQGVEVRAT